MTGLAFALLYAVLGVPVARFSDRYGTDRTALIALALAVWSAMTALCGVAQSFAQLVAARIGVGAGEAGSTPPSHSLISDLVPPRKRAAALAMYGSGIRSASCRHGAGRRPGGLLGWRGAFLVLGIPGMLIALVVWKVVPEPAPQGARAFRRRGPGGACACAVRIGDRRDRRLARPFST
ncbi:MAG: MFS transporter [Sphingomonas sp.]